MVYWGPNPKYILRDLGEIIGFTQQISEGKSFKNEFPKMKKYLASNQPIMVGALDMYYLHYYPDLYNKQHIPIHYILLVGYDDERQIVYVHDCSIPEVQKISYYEFEQSLNVNVPGMSKKNTYRVFEMPSKFISELELAERGLTHKAEQMLNPSVSLLGIPAILKLSKEITAWDNKECFKHLVAYAGLIPPLISKDLSHNDGSRFKQAQVLSELGFKYNRKQWKESANLFNKSGELIIKLCSEAMKYNGEACSKTLSEIASVEEEGYRLLLS